MLDFSRSLTRIGRQYFQLKVLLIRLSRVGKQNQAAFRIVLGEKSDAVKGASQEILGFYNPAEKKKVEFKRERIEYWISKGAHPSDRVASLLKENGVPGMEKYMEPRNKKRARKGAVEETASVQTAAEAPREAQAAAQDQASVEAQTPTAPAEGPLEAPQA